MLIIVILLGILHLAVLALLLYLYLIAPARTRGAAKEKARALWGTWYAHRGLHSEDRSVPENSMTAFRAAREQGYGIELDLTITRDGQVVVFHDDTLERICGVPGSPAEMSLEELKALRILDTDERIPLFRDVLAEIAGAVPLIVELKDTPRRDELCRAAAVLLDTYGGPFCIESFHPGIVRWFRRNRPEIIRGQLSAGHREFPDQSPPVRHLLASLLTNVAARPHFVAYRHQDARRGGTRGGENGGSRSGSRDGPRGGARPPLLRRLALFRLLGGALVAWTVTGEDDPESCRESFDAVIFEYFRPATDY